AREELRRVERERRGPARRGAGVGGWACRAGGGAAWGPGGGPRPPGAVRVHGGGRGGGGARLRGRPSERAARLPESQRNERALRRSAGQVDPAVTEAVGALERDLAVLRRVTGLGEEGRS